MRIPRYISDYVNQLNEIDVRHQYAQLLAKRHAEQRKATMNLTLQTRVRQASLFEETPA